MTLETEWAEMQRSEGPFVPLDIESALLLFEIDSAFARVWRR